MDYYPPIPRVTCEETEAGSQDAELGPEARFRGHDAGRLSATPQRPFCFKAWKS